MTDTQLFDHIRNMLPTTVPAMLIALAIYTVMGFNLGEGEPSFERIESFKTALDGSFDITPWLLLPALLVIGLAMMKMPAIPTLFIGVVVASLIAIFVQGASVHDVFTYANYGYSVETGVEAMDALMNRGGIQSMMWTISLIRLRLVLVARWSARLSGCDHRAADQAGQIHRGRADLAILSRWRPTPWQATPICRSLPGRMFKPVYDRIGYRV